MIRWGSEVKGEDSGDIEDEVGDDVKDQKMKVVLKEVSNSCNTQLQHPVDVSCAGLLTVLRFLLRRSTWFEL